MWSRRLWSWLPLISHQPSEARERGRERGRERERERERERKRESCFRSCAPSWVIAWLLASGLFSSPPDRSSNLNKTPRTTAVSNVAKVPFNLPFFLSFFLSCRTGTRTWRAFSRCTRAWRRTSSPTRSTKGSHRCRCVLHCSVSGRPKSSLPDVDVDTYIPAQHFFFFFFLSRETGNRNSRVRSPEETLTRGPVVDCACITRSRRSPQTRFI